MQQEGFARHQTHGGRRHGEQTELPGWLPQTMEHEQIMTHTSCAFMIVDLAEENPLFVMPALSHSVQSAAGSTWKDRAGRIHGNGWNATF